MDRGALDAALAADFDCGGWAPGGVGSASGTFLRPGDYMRATIGPIGTLETPVEAEDEDDL